MWLWNLECVGEPLLVGQYSVSFLIRLKQVYNVNVYSIVGCLHGLLLNQFRLQGYLWLGYLVCYVSGLLVVTHWVLNYELGVR